MTEIQTLPGVSWWHVIVELERHGYAQREIAAAIGTVARSTVENWKNRAQGPRWEDGQKLIALWKQVTGKTEEDLPLRTTDILSASNFRQLGTPRA